MRRYDPAAKPLWEEEKGEDAKEALARKQREKSRLEEDQNGYAWVRAVVWATPKEDDHDFQMQVECYVTPESSISVMYHPMFHVRKLVNPKEKLAKKVFSRTQICLADCLERLIMIAKAYAIPP